MISYNSYDIKLKLKVKYQAVKLDNTVSFEIIQVFTIFSLLLILICINFLFSEDLAKLAARKYARIIQKLGFPVRIIIILLFCLWY